MDGELRMRVGSRRLLVALGSSILILLLLVGAAGAQWSFERADKGEQYRYLTDRSLRLDAVGRPHIAYGWHELHFAWHDGAAWQFELVDGQADVGWHAALALDGDGDPCISYHDEGRHDLKYARKDAAGWHVETVDSAGWVGEYTSVGVSPTGMPHISYYDRTNETVKHAWYTGLGWNVETVGEHGDLCWSTSLAVDGDGYPHLTYASAFPHEDLMYAFKDASGWHFEKADSQVTTIGSYNSLALDGNGSPHIAYCDLSYHDAKYARRDASGWHVQVVDAGTGVGSHISLALDSEENPHLSYRDESGENLKHAHWDGFGWALSTADDQGSTGLYTSIAVDGQDYPHIVCCGWDGVGLKYVRLQASGWSVATLQYGRVVGTHTSLALGTDGSRHVSYVDETGLDLMYAHCDSAGWVCERVDSTMEVGKYNSLALDGAGDPHISYYYGNDGWSLMYARKHEGEWRTEVVDPGGPYLWVGQHTSLALDAAGRPYISYTYEDPQYLAWEIRCAHLDAAGWHKEVVDDQDYPQGHTSLELDAEEYPHVSYTYNPGLRYGRRDSTGWFIYTADWDATEHTSLALGTDGYPHISCVDPNQGWLKYAWTDGSGWNVEIVDTQDWIQGETSLTLDAAGYPHISYWDAGNKDLKYAYKDPSGWRIWRVDSVGAVGAHSCIALDAMGRPHISYEDSTYGDLKYAIGGGTWVGMVLSASLDGSALALDWTPFASASAYWVYGAGNDAWFVPSLAPGFQHRLAVLFPAVTAWSSVSGVGDPDSNWTYLVLAVDALGRELCRSNRVGEHDCDTGIQ